LQSVRTTYVPSEGLTYSLAVLVAPMANMLSGRVRLGMFELDLKSGELHSLQQFTWSVLLREERRGGGVRSVTAYCVSKVAQYVALLPFAGLGHSE
jgi:hypothetical protein